MPWVEASLRGQRVYAKAKSDGSLDADDGRVEIRYKPSDGRAYRANVRNLAVAHGAPLLPDDACALADFVAPRTDDPPAAPAPRASAGTRRAPSARTADAWLAYTDGACSGNPGPAGAGFILVEPNGKMHEGYEYLGEATNNIAELTAILRALEAAPPRASKLVVHTDSKYAIGVLTQGWKAKSNQELIVRTKAAIAKRGGSVHLEYVPGHEGVPLNERADELAREAIRARDRCPISIADF
jgi:ribonuclease HI